MLSVPSSTLSRHYGIHINPIEISRLHGSLCHPHTLVSSSWITRQQPIRKTIRNPSLSSICIECEEALGVWHGR